MKYEFQISISNDFPNGQMVNDSLQVMGTKILSKWIGIMS